MFKEIISDQDGLYRDPYNAAVIKGDDLSTNLISKYVSDPYAVITPYGAQIVSPGTPNINLKGNMAVELPFNTNKMNYQEGGAASQQQQIIQQVAQMLQQGANPQQVMQQLVKMGMPSKQAEQLLTSVIQQMEAAMAEQQQMQNEDMGGQEQMPMAMEGGRACIDCEEQFPQAQNLNWFYKAEGGEAFPQANPYPHMYAEGGEAFPQAQPYDRGTKPRGNFMFEYGGTTDIEQAYQMMKRGGMDMNPKKKKGGKFTQESFEEYVMRNGGDLPMHQWQQSQTGIPNQNVPNLGWIPDAQRRIQQATGTNSMGAVIPNIKLPNVNRQPSFAEQNPQAMQNIMGSTSSQGQQQRQGSAPAQSQRPAANATTAAAARTAGSASGVRRTPAPTTTPAATPAATPRDNSVVTMMTPKGVAPIPMQPVDMTAQRPADQTQNTGANAQTDNTKSNQNQSYFNPYQSYLAGKNAAGLFGNKAAAGLGLLSFIPGFGNAVSTGSPYGNALLGARRPKIKGRVIGPYGEFSGKLKGANEISDMFTSIYTPPQKQFGGPSDWELSYYDPNAGMEDYLGASSFQSGVLQGIDARKLKEQQDKLMNQDTVSSGIAMGPIASKTPGAAGTTNTMGMVNPSMSGQQGNFGQGAYQSSMLTAKYGGNILDEFEDGGVYDMDGMSEEEIRNFVDAIYAAGGSVEYL